MSQILTNSEAFYFFLANISTTLSMSTFVSELICNSAKALNRLYHRCSQVSMQAHLKKKICSYDWAGLEMVFR